MDFVTSKRFVRDIQGPAASVLWILLLSGRSLTNPELQDATDYSENLVRQGITRLAEYGLVQDNGPRAGWSLRQTTQLPLPLQEVWKRLWQGYSGNLETKTTVPAQVSGSPGVQTETAVFASQVVDNSVDNSKLITGGGANGWHANGVKPVDCGDKPRNVRGLAAYHDHDHVVDDVISNSQTFISSSSSDHDRGAGVQSEGLGDVGILVRLLRAVNIQGEFYTYILQSGLPWQWLLAWHWSTLCNPRLNNPAGFISSRYSRKIDPPHDFAELVGFWCRLSRGQRAAVAFAGSGMGHYDLDRWWPDDVPMMPELAQAAWAQLRTARHDDELWIWPDDIYAEEG